jgi:hypothetical protein
MPLTLSKSDFKVAQTCATKLYYKELGYPSTKDDDAYLELLAKGGYMVEAIAKLLYPEGRTLSYDGGSEASAELTRQALAADQVTLFEATFISNGKLARTDILKKEGTTLDLIEVKAKSYSSSAAIERALANQPNPLHGVRGAIDGDWRPYLEDITFQVLVLRELFPDATIRPSLALVDKDKTVSEDLLHQHFRFTSTKEPGRRFATPTVEFTGDAERIREDHFITIVDVAAEVEELLPEVSAAAATFVASLTPTLRKIVIPISVACRDCEYRVEASVTPNGFGECWGDLADVERHILDLHHVSEIGPKDDRLADQLIRQRQCSLSDVPIHQLTKKGGDVGKRNKRQILQIEHTLAGTTWIAPELAETTSSPVYPLHFIDFETSALAIPYHAGMRPYETVAFQWSCHTVPAPGATPTHADWINPKDFFPNAEFARTLRAHIGTGGTVFMWAHHEESVLRTIRGQLQRYNAFEPDLADWIDGLAGTDKNNRGRLVDMNQMTLDGYFHPDMKGRTSIKVVLPAVWKADAAVRDAFPEYVRYEGERLLDPYESLPPIEIAGEIVHVSEGTDAMLAYQEMLYGVSRDDPVARDNYRNLLRQYCRLDTAAMVMIWQHWWGMAAALTA